MAEGAGESSSRPSGPESASRPSGPELAALADLTDALAVADDEEAALAAVTDHLPRLGLAAGEATEIAAAAARVRDTWHEGQVSGRAGLGDEGSAVLRLVTTLLAGQLRTLRMLAAQEAMAEERAVLQAVMHRLNASPSLEAALRAFRLAAPAGDDAAVLLCSVEDGANGAPEWMTVAAMLPAAGRPATAQVGARYHLPQFPMSRLLLASPGEPILISSVADDPRVDEPTRAMYAKMGLRSALIMAVTLRGRIAGTLGFSWSQEVALGDRERRIYQALARQAALLVDNNSMIERLQASLQETRQQGQLLGTVLDHIPVGIACLEAGGRGVSLANRAAQALLGDNPQTEAQLLFPGTDTAVPAAERPGQRALAAAEVVRDELDLIPRGGSRLNLEIVGVPLFGADGKPERVVLVLSDVTARKQEAEARARLQEEVIRVQANALAERSSPLIPITEDVLVMPLIGTIDADRGDQILEAVLAGTRQRAARVTIIDVTGVPSIDERAAAVLTGAARALRLLGVEAVLSGVGPDVAQALVNLDVPLAGIKTCGTLQVAVQYALRRLGKRI
jgi:anti-anti-sigma regulatory factor/PAS domain-containing protein